MFENRARGAQLVKRISYFYLIIAILAVIVTFVLGINIFITNIIFYIIMFAALYLISTKFKDNEKTWILVVICAIITLLWTLSLAGIALFIILIIAADDIRKELD